MTILLDTNLLVANWKPPAHESCAISAASLAELHFGVLVVDDPAVRALRLKRLTAIEHAFDPIPFDAAVARTYGELADAVKRGGQNPRTRTFDLVIAATARSVGAELYTLNPKDFRHLSELVKIVTPAIAL